MDVSAPATLEGTADPRPTRRSKNGLFVQRAMTIAAPAEPLYAMWHDFEQLPTFMKHLESVTVQDARRSHWVAKLPIGPTIEWDAETVEDRPGELIAWRSLPGASVENAGSVRFRPAPANRGTEVYVTLEYNPPGGILGDAIAGFFNEAVAMTIKEDLRRFKALVEAGEAPTTEGQPSGRKDDAKKNEEA